ncbi:MAG: DNA cytosine methyltransferase [Anaerovoracaceae bacterium]|nr:DNA cytosine methyltransferase [Anaerovoracaceae bacterium]
MYSVIDLFAGAGGLSLGFQQTQKYTIKVAFENSPYMQDTYRKNHPGVEVLGDVCSADYTQIVKKHGPIDVVIGGPPCQGFSNANRQKNHAISQNNMLVKQYIRAILELQPKAFVMENVSMLRSEVHRFYLEKQDEDLIKTYKIPVKETPLQLISQEFTFVGVQDIIKDKQRVLQYLWPEAQYTVLNVFYKASKNEEKLIRALAKHRKKAEIFAEDHKGKDDCTDPIILANAKASKAILSYYDGSVQASDLKPLIEPAIMIQRMLSKACEIFDNNIVVDRYDYEDGVTAVIRSFAVYDYLTSILGSETNGYVITSKVLCAADYGAPQKRMRFVVMGIKKSISSKVALPNGHFDEDQYRSVKDAISDIEDVKTVVNLEDDAGTPLAKKQNLSELAKVLRDSDVLKNHLITNTTDTAMQRFKALKQGQNFHSLSDAMKTNTYTEADRTQNTIYLRLNYNEPCGTVVNVRKSMWIHPVLDRAISVREAARLQTFPDSFVFCGSKDKQYQQVGNAVPPIMAKSIAKKLANLLSKGLEEKAENSG